MPAAHRWETARIPVFASVPSKLNDRQLASWQYIRQRLHDLGLEPRTVGISDPGIYNPLHEVRTLARHCAGGIILGYGQVTAERANGLTTQLRPDGSPAVVPTLIRKYIAPTPWNQLETGVLFGLGLPLFVLKQQGIAGGIFDEGASDVLVHTMPMPPDGATCSPAQEYTLCSLDSFENALLRWQSLVRSHYYDVR